MSKDEVLVAYSPCTVPLALTVKIKASTIDCSVILRDRDVNRPNSVCCVVLKLTIH